MQGKQKSQRENQLPENISHEPILPLFVFSGLALDYGTGLCLTGDFDRQFTYILNSIRLTEADMNRMNQAQQVVEKTLQAKWPGSKLTRYGSIVSGLAVKSSDIDCYIKFSELDQINQNDIAVKLEETLREYSNLFGRFKRKTIPTGTILKFLYLPTEIRFDVSLSTKPSINGSRIIGYLMQLDQRAADFTTFLRMWGKVHKLTGSGNIIPSYSMTMFSIFYLQQQGILPPIALLQNEIHSIIVQNCNVAFKTIEFKNINKKSIYELVGGFFEYYSDFNFDDYVIAPYVGYEIKKSKFINVEDLPNDLSLYKGNVRNKTTESINLGSITIQDFLNHSENVVRFKNPNVESELFKNMCKYCSRMYREQSKDGFLRSILDAENFTRDRSLN